jgi:hypothetical protein
MASVRVVRPNVSSIPSQSKALVTCAFWRTLVMMCVNATLEAALVNVDMLEGRMDGCRMGGWMVVGWEDG